MPEPRLVLFSNLDLEEPEHLTLAASYESVSLPCCPSLDELCGDCGLQARDLFQKALTWLNKALDFFVLDGFVTEHIQILQVLCVCVCVTKSWPA